MIDLKEVEILSGKIYRLLVILRFCCKYEDNFYFKKEAVNYLVEYTCKLADKLNVKFIEK